MGVAVGAGVGVGVAVGRGVGVGVALGAGVGVGVGLGATVEDELAPVAQPAVNAAMDNASNTIARIGAFTRARR